MRAVLQQRRPKKLVTQLLQLHLLSQRRLWSSCPSHYTGSKSCIVRMRGRLKNWQSDHLELDKTLNSFSLVLQLAALRLVPDSFQCTHDLQGRGREDDGDTLSVTSAICARSGLDILARYCLAPVMATYASGYFHTPQATGLM